jgi:Skp family chaperone for outer membrane proteins
MVADPTKAASGQPSVNASGDADGNKADNTNTNADDDGTDQDDQDDGQDDHKRKDGKVSLASHRKLLAEKKALQAKLAKIEADRHEAERTELERQGEFKKLLELERQRAQELEQKLTAREQEDQSRRKLAAVLKNVGGVIHSKYYDLIPYDSVVIDPDTGDVDSLSVTKVVESLRASYPEIISKGSAKMPQHAPKGGAKTISYAEWSKLPSKEMDKWDKSQIVD